MTVHPVHPAGGKDAVRTLSSVSRPVQTFTVATAARECGVVEKTIRRKLNQLEQHGAERSDDGQWVIPWAALHAIGLHPGKPSGPVKSTGQPSMSSGLDQDSARERIEQLERQVRDEHAGRVLAEQVAAERERIIQAQAQTLRILEAGTITRDTTERSVAMDQGGGTVEGTITGQDCADPVTVGTGRSEMASAGVGATEVPPASRPVRFWDRLRRVR